MGINYYNGGAEEQRTPVQNSFHLVIYKFSWFLYSNNNVDCQLLLLFKVCSFFIINHKQIYNITCFMTPGFNLASKD